MSTAEKPTCFVIAPIGDTGSETRKRSDKVLAHVFGAALDEEYKVTRADKISEPGMITSQILRALQDSDLVIADLTEHNANVFYELAVRHAVEKPVIHVIDSRWKIPFDVAGFRTIVFDFTDLDSVADAIKQLKEQASEIRSGKQGETPIKLANILRRSNADSEDTLLLKAAVQGISSLRTNFDELSALVASQIARSSSFASPNLANLRSLLGDPAYPPVVPAGASETLAAHTLLRHASQPDEVPARQPADDLAQNLRPGLRPKNATK